MAARDRILSSNVFEHPLDVDPLEPGSVVAGEPATAVAELVEAAFARAGVWGITEGTVTDVEVDEVFVVLSGAATLTIEGEGSLELRPGAAVRLHAGDRTVWEVHERLRKIYLV